MSSDVAWAVHPDWLVFLGGYRLYNHIGTTWHYLSGGPRVEAVGRVFKAMSHRRRAGRLDWFGDASALFERKGGELQLDDRTYHGVCTSLHAEDDLSLVFARRDGSREHRWPLDTSSLREAGRLLAAMSSRHSAASMEEHAPWRPLLQRWSKAGLIHRVPRGEARPRPPGHVLRLTGHAGVGLETPTTRVLIDPVLTLRYRPDVDRTDELHGPLDAVVLTQGRWGHLDIDTLLRIDRRVPVYVARREHPPSFDNIDLPALLDELGFTEVRQLTPWQATSIGDVELMAVPFRGAGLSECSATDWMTLYACAGGRSVFISANACDDQRGSMDAVVRELRRRRSVDVVLAGYMDYWYPLAWFTRRPFYLGAGRERGSTSAEDALRWTTLLGAEVLLPYAGFAWSEPELRRKPHPKPLYGGVVQRGSLEQLAVQLGRWSSPRAWALAAGGELRWEPGGPFEVRSATGAAIEPLGPQWCEASRATSDRGEERAAP